MVKKAGLKMPPDDGNWTFEDLITLAKGLTKSEGGRTTVYGIMPGFRTATANEGIVGLLRAFGGDLFDADGKKCLLNTPESIKGLKVMADLYKSGCGLSRGRRTSDTIAQDLFLGQQGRHAGQHEPAARRAWSRPRSPSRPIRSRWTCSRTRSARPASTPPRSRPTARACPRPRKNPDKAWTVLSQLYTGQRHGIERFANGLGSPGSRNDVWDSPEFRETAPKLANIAKVLVLPPAPEMAAWLHPANGRFAEHEPILLNEFVKVTLGQMTVEQYARTGRQADPGRSWTSRPSVASRESTRRRRAHERGASPGLAHS